VLRPKAAGDVPVAFVATVSIAVYGASERREARGRCNAQGGLAQTSVSRWYARESTAPRKRGRRSIAKTQGAP